MRLINTDFLLSPYNWAVVVLTILLGLVLLHILSPSA